MNPHFIFNSLNSIQNFVAQNDQKEAFLYLSRFGKLMRRVLDNSEEDQIPVEEEVETLRLYLQLEQLRANNFFDFEIKISDNIEADYHMVPPTLIQPMLENAIWHGVMHRQTKGLIELEFELEDDTIVCIVRDNGVGREKAKTLEELNKKDHKSKGLSITRERLVLLNDRRKNQIALEILDLTDSAGKCMGATAISTGLRRSPTSRSTITASSMYRY
jgi:LytS/YehU family sensor histidine kinase